ncbi:hypothetical protein KCU74_g82, partial [Aureobasidium melanogenum]
MIRSRRTLRAYLVERRERRDALRERREEIDGIISGTFTLTPCSVVSCSLTRFSRSCCILGAILRHDTLSAVGTSVVLAQPGFDTVGVEPMTAG